MATVIDANMRVFAEKMHITSSRMINDYGLKTVDEIIEAEAAQGNMHAVKYAGEMYSSPEKLIKVFKLADVENKFVLLHKMDDRTRQKLIPLLDKEDLVMGLYFFTQEKLLQILSEVDIEELVNVVLAAFPLTSIIQMLPEDELAMFFQNKEIEKSVIMKELKLMPPEVLQKFIEGVTGKPSEDTNSGEFLKNIENLPDDKFRDFMSVIDPDIQRQLIFQLSKEDTEYLQYINPYTYTDMLSTMMKAEMVKPMIALEKDTLVSIISTLPPDLLSIVGAQIDTREFAKFLQDGHLDVLKEAMMI